MRKPEEAVREIKHTLKYAVVPEGSRPEIAFADSNVNANHRTLKRFVDLLLEENVAITWGGQAHIQPEMTREFLATMRKAGCTSIFWGIETGSQHVVDLMNKSYDAKVARRVLDDCIAVGIRSYIPIILGFPGETPEDIAETIGFIFTYQGPCTILQPGMCLVRKNAPLFERYQDFNLANNFSYDWHTQDGSNTIGVRIIRRFIVNQACCNPTLGEAEMPDTEELKNIDLNAPHHSREWYRVLRALHGQYCANIAFHQFLDGTGEERGGILRRLFGSRADREITPEKWLTRDINSDEGRARLYRTTLKALAQVKARLRPASGVH